MVVSLVNPIVAFICAYDAQYRVHCWEHKFERLTAFRIARESADLAANVLKLSTRYVMAGIAFRYIAFGYQHVYT